MITSNNIIDIIRAFFAKRANPYWAGLFRKFLSQKECRIETTHFSIISANDRNWPNYQNVHCFECIAGFKDTIAFITTLQITGRIAPHQVMGMQGWVLFNAKDSNTVTHRITGTQYNTKQQQFLKEIFQALPFLPPGTSELRTSHLIGAAAFWLSHALVDKMHLYTNGIKGRQHWWTIGKKGSDCFVGSTSAIFSNICRGFGRSCCSR